ncbi:DUF6597 domain-containing transcriptional factor [uncultured Chryseobacterium sp.]|uniref:DUF6597 domain-containing transcriptional factor n=1 Tax=uncultured Chryseobacterium sp. TaxID=259322 RepID=UPI00258EE259|nr:DUF6597 domain-containing transcriptional factor [uncultured Chryseobacterium sp.]
MNYQTFEPDQDLTAFIKCYWTLESPKEETPEKQTIVPDGCIEISFDYTEIISDSMIAEISETKNGQNRKHTFPMKRVKR